MSRVKIQKKVKKVKTLDNQEVIETFQDMLTGSNKPDKCDLTIVWPKYKNIEETVGKFIGLMKTLSNSTMMKLFPDESMMVNDYVERLEKEFGVTFNVPDLNEYSTLSFYECPQEVHTAFGEKYFACKDSAIVKSIIETCSNLIEFKKFIGDKNDLHDVFLTRTAVGTVNPFDGLDIDVKFMYNQLERGSQGQTYMMLVLSKTYQISYKLYELITSPDYNIDEFVSVVHDSLGSVKGMVPRCDEAFNKILSSVDLLKTNFTSYNRDFIATGNPTIIMENFVVDVAVETKASPTLMGQFKKIIDFYRKQAKEHSQNPTMKSLFAEVDRNMSSVTERMESRRKLADASTDVVDDEGPSTGDLSADQPDPPADDTDDVVDSGGTKKSRSSKKREKQKRSKMRKELDKSIEEHVKNLSIEDMALEKVTVENGEKPDRPDRPDRPERDEGTERNEKGKNKTRKSKPKTLREELMDDS